jgi:hypothetical protein
MKDPTIPDAKTRKKFMFYDTEKRQADLRIRCGYDGINQSQFFRMMITGYLENDSGVLEYINNLQGKLKRNYIKRMHGKAQETKKKFALDDNDLESIFDIIAEDHPEI